MVGENNEDYLGFEIKNLSQAKTKEKKIRAMEEHLSMIESLYDESKAWLEKRIYELKRE